MFEKSKLRQLRTIFGFYVLIVVYTLFSTINNTTAMILDLFADKNGIIKIGTVKIFYDRISGIDIRMPVDQQQARASKTSTKNKKKPIIRKVYSEYHTDEPCSFNLFRLSKADTAYRQHKLTHRLECQTLTSAVNSVMYIKLKKFQSYILNYHARKLFWQTGDFQSNIARSVVSYLIPLVIGSAGTLYIVAFKKGNDGGNVHEVKQPEKNPALNGSNENKKNHLPDSALQKPNI